jgi:hypothetical protein
MEDLWQKCMLLGQPLMQTFYGWCKPVFHNMQLHVSECMVDMAQVM